MVAVIDGRMPCSAKSKLCEICEVIELPPFSALDPRVASHPDMLLKSMNGRLFVPKDYYIETKHEIDLIISKTSLKLSLTNDKLGREYPLDVAYNFFTLKNAIVGNTAHISEEIKKYALSRGFVNANVKQGYAKCSSVVLENAVITADQGIYNTARKLGVDALLICSGGVILEGYDYGFLGGASGVYGNKVYFCGDISKHKDGTEISAFCQKQGYEVISLSDAPLYDVGTILFFCNNNHL